ncbi:MAG: hypothetical protein Q7S92_01550 [Candidatus Diapherotrites archaeon]|nr:hypothetical protein [Candidatus Diapherotrites archaeon]
MRNLRPRLARRRMIHGKSIQLIGIGDEGKAWKLKSFGKRKPIVVKVYKKTANPKKVRHDYIARQIAWLLFPKNFPKSYSMTIHKSRIRIAQQYREPNPELKALQVEMIEGTPESEHTAHLIQMFAGNDNSTKRLIEIRAAGLSPDSFAANYGFFNPSEPVVYELKRLNSKRVRSYLAKQAMPVRRRRQILKLLEEYERMEKF